MTEQERELDFALAEAEAENKLLRARNEKLERETQTVIAEAYRAGVTSGIAAEQERCCSIVFGVCESDNVAQRTVDAIRLGANI